MKKTLTQRIGAWGSIVALVGVVVSPAVVGAASGNDSSTVSATIGDTLSMSSADTVSFTIAPTSGGVVSSDFDTVTVSTNKTNGYNLTLADSDATTTLTSGGNSFTASTATKSASAALTNGTWGFALASGTSGLTSDFDASYSAETNNATSTSKWAGVPATGAPVTIKSTSTTATNDNTVIWFAAKANTSQPTGTYTDSVTYTATTN